MLSKSRRFGRRAPGERTADQYRTADAASMKSSHLKLSLTVVTLGLTSLAFSQLGTPPTGSTQPFAAAPDSVIVTPITEGYFVANGATYHMRNGNAFKVEREVSIRVTPGGIIGFDGKPLALGAGMMLTPDGRHAPIPAGINLQALPGNANPFPASPAEARRASESAPRPAVRDTPELQVEPARER